MLETLDVIKMKKLKAIAIKSFMGILVYETKMSVKDWNLKFGMKGVSVKILITDKNLKKLNNEK